MEKREMNTNPEIGYKKIRAMKNVLSMTKVFNPIPNHPELVHIKFTNGVNAIYQKGRLMSLEGRTCPITKPKVGEVLTDMIQEGSWVVSMQSGKNPDLWNITNYAHNKKALYDAKEGHILPTSIEAIN